MTRFFENGHGETTKACVHGTLGLCALACFGYNVIALWHRGDRHLARNALVYGALTIYEGCKVHRHTTEARCPR